MKRKIGIILAVLIAFSLFTVIVTAKQFQVVYTKIPSVNTMQPLSPGTKAPFFSIENIDGEKISLEQYVSKKPVLLFFWSFFCGPCRKEMPLINKVTKQYHDSGLVVLAINLDGKEMKRVLQRLIEKEDIDYSIAIDELNEDSFNIAGPYGVEGVPSLFIIDRSGTISYSTVGVITQEVLKKEITKVIQ